MPLSRDMWPDRGGCLRIPAARPCRGLATVPVLAHLHFDFSEIGWEAAVAIGTGVLVLSTGALAAYTAELAKKTIGHGRGRTRRGQGPNAAGADAPFRSPGRHQPA